MITIISPHFDDAVLSCGEHIQAAIHGDHLVRIVTVFTEVPSDELPLTVFDANCGFKSPREAITARARENMRAAMVLDCTTWNLGFFDRQYGAETSYAQLSKELKAFLTSAPPEDEVWLPLGINHPDHELVCLATLDSWSADRRFFIYEDLPSRVTAPQTVQGQLDHLRGRGWKLERLPDWRGDVELKLAAIRCYGSQMGLVDWRSCLVPELFWRVSRA